MTSRLSLTLFAHVCSRPEEELDLAEAALLIAEIEHPGLDVARYRAMLDELGEGARAAMEKAEAAGEIGPVDPEADRLDQAVSWLYRVAGFRGNEETYYDPCNSFLDDVLDRRTGIPITLAIVLIEVCRRAGVDARGVSFPGHFLVRSATKHGFLVVDPFVGRIVTRDEVRALYARATGEAASGDPPSRLLEAATKKQILLRMLANLRGIYSNRSDVAHLCAVLERMQVLAPSEELRRELEAIGGTTPWRSGGHRVN